MPEPDDRADRPALSVVVPTRDRPQFLATCLDALLADRPRAAEIIVVDSASVRPVDAGRHTGDITLIRDDRPGASRARNAGWRAASQPVVAFVDDDVQVQPGWAAAIVTPFDDPGVALVTGAVEAPSPSGDRTVATTDDVVDGRFGPSSLGNVGASANLAVRREVLERIGGFDESLGPGTAFRAAEDLDLFDRALLHGHGWHTTAAVGQHEQWRGRRELLALEWAYGIGFGARLAKLTRTDGSRARAIASYELRRLGRDVAGDVRSGYEFGVVSRLVWALGTGRGLVTALPVAVDGGRFRRRRG